MNQQFDMHELNPIKTKKGGPQGRPIPLPKYLLLGVLFAETLDPTGGIDQLLLPGVKRMAAGADFRMDLFFQGRTGFESIPTVTAYGDVVVLRMDSFSHLFSPWRPGFVQACRYWSQTNRLNSSFSLFKQVLSSRPTPS
jgi:hypothetical protein